MVYLSRAGISFSVGNARALASAGITPSLEILVRFEERAAAVAEAAVVEGLVRA